MAKLVRGIVREDKLNEIITALERAGAPGMTVTTVGGRGKTPHTGYWRGVPFPVLLPMCAIEVIVCDNAADDIVRVMIDCAHTGHDGDGHVFVLALDDNYSVRTRWRDVA
jgi:nitrogen regulatory protein P-II 1